MSLGLPGLRNGMRGVYLFNCKQIAFVKAAYITNPTDIELTFIPFGARSRAMALINIISPPWEDSSEHDLFTVTCTGAYVY